MAQHRAVPPGRVGRVPGLASGDPLRSVDRQHTPQAHTAYSPHSICGPRVWCVRVASKQEGSFAATRLLLTSWLVLCIPADTHTHTHTYAHAHTGSGPPMTAYRKAKHGGA